MDTIKLSDAFAVYGAKLKNPQWAVSSMTADGDALVVSCWRHYINVIGDIWRYEDKLSRWPGNSPGNNLLGKHINEAFKKNLPVKLVLAIKENTDAIDSGTRCLKVKKQFDVRPREGRITYFDGDRFVIEFRKKPV